MRETVMKNSDLRSLNGDFHTKKNCESQEVFWLTCEGTTKLSKNSIEKLFPLCFYALWRALRTT